MDTPNTCIYNDSLSWLGTGTSINEHKFKGKKKRKKKPHHKKKSVTTSEKKPKN